MKSIILHHLKSLMWPTIVIPSIFLIGFEIYGAFHPGQDFSLTLSQILLLVLWFIFLAVRGLLALINSQPKKLLSFALSFLCLLPTSFVLSWLSVADYVHLAKDYSKYQMTIATSPHTRHRFTWGSAGWAAGPSCEKTLVYDPADKLPEENKKLDAQWRLKFHSFQGKQEIFKAWLNTKNLLGHFYVVEEWHQA